MRTFLTVEMWQDQWVAGFTGKLAGEGRNALVCLMKVSEAFESHFDLWFSDVLSDVTRQAKVAHLTPLGDLFQPNKRRINPFDPQSYTRPVRNHSHRKNSEWHKDICYEGSGIDRPAALLVGDMHYSFLWDKPMLHYPQQLHRGQRKNAIGELLTSLQEKETR